MRYGTTALELVDRIAAFIEAHPEFLALDTPAQLLFVEGWICGELKPTRFQRDWALQHAKELHAKARQ